MLATEMQISEVIIISIDKSEESWAVEGEIVFDDDLTSAFAVTYLPDEDSDDALEDLSLEIKPGHIDKVELTELIINAAKEFDE